MQPRAGQARAKRGKHKRWWLLPWDGPSRKKREREKIDESAHLIFFFFNPHRLLFLIFFSLLSPNIHPTGILSRRFTTTLGCQRWHGCILIRLSPLRRVLEATPALNSAATLFLRHSHRHLHRLHSFIYTIFRRVGFWSFDRWTLGRAAPASKARSGRASARSAFSASLTTLSERPLSVSRSLTLPWHILGGDSHQPHR